MPNYNDLRPEDDFLKRDYELVFPSMTKTEKRRTIDNLLVLREGLNERIRPRRTDANLLVASWNIKEFGHTRQRLPEAYFYTAEILSRFDLVSIQEIKSSLGDLEILMRLLGDGWAYLVNDITEGQQGNSERSAYIYNRSRVEFGGLAGEIVLWDELTANSDLKQLKRTPYITGFRAGWKTFALVCLHLHPGDGADDVALRRQEVELLLGAIDKKISDERFWNENVALCGDFNFYDGPTKDDSAVQRIREAGFREVESLVGRDTTATGSEAYDRFFLRSNEYFQVVRDERGEEIGGVFDFFDFVYRIGQHESYVGSMKEVYGGSKDLDDPVHQAWYFKNHWRKNQMSDHFPIWFELVTDSGDEFLAEKRAGL